MLCVCMAGPRAGQAEFMMQAGHARGGVQYNEGNVRMAVEGGHDAICSSRASRSDMQAS